jgi:co-chaperonin GroES (HSP10)
MRAINKFMLVRKSKETTKTNGGLLLSAAEEAEFRYQIGVVVSPGTLVEHIKEGDRVYFDKVHAFDIPLDGEMLTVIQERDVVVVL